MMAMCGQPLPEIVNAVSYALLAAALLWVLGGRRAAWAGVFRWIVPVGLLLEAGLAVLAAIEMPMRPSSAAYEIALLASALQLSISLALLFLLGGMDAKLRRAIGRQGRRRIERANQAASQAHLWLEMAEREAHLGHWRLHCRSSVLEWSPVMYELHGLPAASFAPNAQNVPLLFHSEDQSLVAEGFAAALAAGERRVMSARLRRPDTELRHVIISAIGCPDGYILGIMLDVTAQKLADARMREANAVALQANAVVKEMTFEDGLTGLSNRRQFDVSLVHEFKRAVRSNAALGLVMINLDQFALYNELYGHPAGDACLAEVAGAIKALPRRIGDVLARFSGDEIALLLPLADGHGVMRVADIIAKAVRGLRIPHQGSETGFVTVSCGTAVFAGLHDLNNPLDLVRRADQALYKAKSDGRDRVCPYEPGLNGDLRDPYGPAVSHDMERILKSRIV